MKLEEAAKKLEGKLKDKNVDLSKYDFTKIANMAIKKGIAS